MPALVLAVTLGIVARWRSRNDDVSRAKRASPAEVGRALVAALPALLLPFLIRALVVEGVATATEVSTIGVAYSALAGLLLYRTFDWGRLYPMLTETACLSGAILLIIGTATGMAWALTQSGFSRQLAVAMAAMPGGVAGFLAISIAAFVVLGSILEGIPAIVLAMGVGLFAPPFGVGCYSACTVGRINPDAAMKRIWPCLAALIAGLFLVAAVPWFSTGFL